MDNKRKPLGNFVDLIFVYTIEIADLLDWWRLCLLKTWKVNLISRALAVYEVQHRQQQS